jgi:hypothetical protein
MPTFQHTLPPRDKPFGCDLKRTPAAATLRGIITCDTLTTCDTHFYHGRTTPCERIINDNGRTIDDSYCAPCQAKQPWRSHAYVSLFDTRAREHFILELTDAAAQPLEEYYKANGTLRGCAIQAWRPKAAANAKVQVICSPANLQSNPIPAAPNIIAALCVIWRVKMQQTEKTPSAHGRTPTAPSQESLPQLHAPLDNAGSVTDLDQRRREFLRTIGQPDDSNGKQKKQAAKP